MTKPGRAQRLQRIHEAALQLLSERGFWGFHMRDVARAADSSPANFYHYFRDKQDLVYQVLRQTLEGAVASAEAAGTLGSARECLRALVTSHVQRVMSAPAEASLLRGAGLPLLEPQRRRLDALRQEYLDATRRIVDGASGRRGERRGPSMLRAQLLLGMADRAALDGAAADPTPRPSRLAQTLIRIFLDGASR